MDEVILKGHLVTVLLNYNMVFVYSGAECSSGVIADFGYADPEGYEKALEYAFSICYPITQELSYIMPSTAEAYVLSIKDEFNKFRNQIKLKYDDYRRF